MPGFLADRVAAHLVDVEPDGLVFTANRGRSLRSSNWRRRVWGPAIIDAAVDPKLRIHDLRHTAVSLMISSGTNIKAVQRQLGHATAAMTLDLYGHLFDADLDHLSEALDTRFAEADVGTDAAQTSSPITR